MTPSRWTRRAAALATAALALTVPALAPASASTAAGGTVLGWGWAALDAFCRAGSERVAAPTTVAALTDVRQVARSTSTTYALVATPQQDSQVLACGDGAHGSLGASRAVTASHTPVPVGRLRNVRQVVSTTSAQATGLALLRDGTVRAWGQSDALGTGSTADAFRPVTVPGVDGVVQLAAGGGHVLALRADGTVLAWGADVSGEVGVATPPSGVQRTPVVVPGLTGVRSVAAAESTSYAVLADGTVRSWGAAVALGDGSTADRTTPAPVPGLARITQVVGAGMHAAALRADGTVFAWGDVVLGGGLGVPGTSRPTPVRVPVPEPVDLLAVAANSGYGVVAGGRVYAWGSARFGLLGDGTTSGSSGPQPVPGLTGVSAVFTGVVDTFAVRPTA